MTFQLQHPTKVWDEEITTDKWPLPPAKPWEPKSSIEQMCEEARERLAKALEFDVAEHLHWMRVHDRMYSRLSFEHRQVLIRLQEEAKVYVYRGD